MKNRIWELDALRGACILGMLAVHFLFDATELYGLLDWELPRWLLLVQDWGGVLFLLISGICVTLGSRCVRRGFLVFSCGMLCTAVTACLYFWGLADKGILIYFGILHCLGVCMVLWKPLEKLPLWALALLGAGLACAGLYLDRFVRIGFDWLCPLGLRSNRFTTADYFPMLPNLGFFLLGTVLGRTLYRQKRSVLPGIDPNLLPIRFLSLCGRHSLVIYLVHQPVLSVLLWSISLLFQEAVP